MLRGLTSNSKRRLSEKELRFIDAGTLESSA
jgi:hypothetical protein